MTTSIDEYKAAAAKAMPERELQENVRQLCKRLNALYYHTHRSQHSPAGFPDCVIVTEMPRDRLIFAELKRQDTDLSDAQMEWLNALHGIVYPEVYVWRPSDWLDGTIERILTGETT